jgi:hypothetical protein
MILIKSGPTGMELQARNHNSSSELKYSRKFLFQWLRRIGELKVARIGGKFPSQYSWLSLKVFPCQKPV